ncbi:MAG TPA: 16S rRNA processing protein RimM [Clostridia bacterium]|nr:16S rRNA processing protein RimM [Clostridia bacterium]
MPNITIKRPVIIKIKVTEKFKSETIEQIEKALERVNLEIEQIEFQEKRISYNAEKQLKQRYLNLRQQMEEEKKKRLELKTKLLEKIEEVKKWEIGLEVIEGTMESLVEVKEGDDWDRIMKSEIIIEDGKVIEIK